MNSNRTARRAQAAKVRHLKRQARGEFKIEIVAASDDAAQAARQHFAAACIAGTKPRCLACSFIFAKPKDAAAFLIVKSMRGSKAAQVPVCRNCMVLRRAKLPLHVDKVLKNQLGIEGVWCPDDATDD